MKYVKMQNVENVKDSRNMSANIRQVENLKIKGMNRVQLKKIKSEIESILDQTEKYVDIENFSEVEIIQSLYLETGKINQVMVAINAFGFKIKSDKSDLYRVYNCSDITKIINENSDTELGAITQAFFNYNCNKCGWTSLLKNVKQ